MIIPRHPQRFSEVESLILKNGYACNLASHPNKSNQSNTIVLGNTMGEMYKYISVSDLVLIGGSFKNFGSQSPIEALLLKTQTQSQVKSPIFLKTKMKKYLKRI
jgi:3-deoxy-D-manno-octulosonic-acid transferase